MKGSTALALMAAALAAGAAQAAVSESEAIAIALKDAGVVGQAEVTASSFATANGTSTRDVFFQTATASYHYVLDVETGDILKRDARSTDVVTDATSDRARAMDVFASDGVAPDKARSIALSHAGVSEFDATHVQVRAEHRGHDKTVYEVTFRTKEERYSYEIDGATGDVLLWERERN